MNAFYEPSRFTDLISRKHVKLKYLLEDKKSSNSISYAVLNKKTATPEIYNVMKNFILVKSENNNLILNPIDDDDDRDDNEDTQIVESVGVIDKAHNNSSTVMIAPMESHNDIDENDPFDMPEPIVEFAKDVNLLAIDSLMAGLNAPPSIDVLTTLPKVAVFKGKRGVSLNLKKK